MLPLIHTCTTHRLVQWSVGVYRSVRLSPAWSPGQQPPLHSYWREATTQQFRACVCVRRQTGTMAKDGGFYGCVEDYVKERGGNRPIKKVSGYGCVLRETSFVA